MQALILAGGEGTRLKPFTNVIPKPLVPIGDLPILEVVLRQLKYHGADRIVLAVNKLDLLI
jgi:NDP-sugar pyrophosphorylase family protein